MSNSYTIHTAYDALTMTQAEAEEITRLLEEGVPDPDASEADKDDPDFMHNCGLEMYWCRSGEAFRVLSDEYESSRIDYMSEAARKAIGVVIEREGLEFITIGYANTCDRTLLGSHGGGELRLYADGTLEYPEFLYTHKVQAATPDNEKSES